MSQTIEPESPSTAIADAPLDAPLADLEPVADDPATAASSPATMTFSAVQLEEVEDDEEAPAEPGALGGAAPQPVAGPGGGLLRRRLPLLLAVAALAPLVLSVVMTVQFFDARDRANDLADQVETLNSQLASARSATDTKADELKNAKASAKKAKGDLEEAKRELTDARQQIDDDKAHAEACVRAVENYYTTWENTFYHTNNGTAADSAAADYRAQAESSCGPIDISMRPLEPRYS
ncbi:hypothetical protein [Dactylosporangium sp. NPDC048998]|uniref:hypothetical protein n=1 Tax=Dactylosporangium sp. NPDC048998 TaxID=3363976 RepID=UPI0037179015